MTLANTDTPTYALDDLERRAFHAFGAALAQRFDAEAGRAGIDLAGVPDGLRRFVAGFAAEPPHRGFALLSGIEIDELPPTPNTHTTTPVAAGHSTAGNLLAVGELLGFAVGYADEKDGALVHEVHPVHGEEHRMENTGSVDFAFHTENAHHPLRPDYLALLCLRQDHDNLGVTRLASVRDAVRDLSDHTVSVLASPRFQCRYPTSFTRGRADESPMSEPHPVLSGSAPDYFMRFDTHNTRALDDTGAAALRELSAALDGASQSVLLQPGDLVLIDNSVAAHGRSPFRPRYDGSDRWLRRCYALRTVPAWAWDVMPRPRVLPSVSDVLRAQTEHAGQPLRIS